MTTYDAVVVGSGPNGLSAALAWAKAGRSVLVCEASATIGGGTRTKDLFGDGSLHDICSAIHPMAQASPFWRSLGLAEQIEWIHPPVAAAHPLDGGNGASVWRSVDDTAEALGKDAKAYRSKIGPIARDFEALIQDALAPLGIPHHPLTLTNFGLSALQPARLLTNRWFSEDAAKALFAGVAAHSVIPLEAPFSSAIGLMLLAAGHAVGWPLPKGGSQQVTAVLAKMLEAEGGVIECNRQVTALADLPTEGPVFFDTSPKQLVLVAGEALSPAYRARLERFAHGPGVCKVDYRLKEPVPWAYAPAKEAGTVHLGGTFDEIAKSEAATFHGEVAENPYVLVAQQSLFDDTRTPDDTHTLWAYCHVPNGDPVDASAAITAQIERFAPGFGDVVADQHVMRAPDFETYNANYVGGDMAGGANTWDQLFTRPLVSPDPYSTEHPRLFLCSASTPPGGGVHGMCGYHAAQSALKRFS